ncbi:hypothetical protein [Paracoccus aminophilus]|uniref:Uncharacterized protein n=1 Tax=Paracoccus aminophilus JCM 7686 TaxID=1367847 RepID=S5Y958_PARAH|nr:hypothetical protein [Paracoccus aminophilus]AGT07893.1 hypothetical protein JCM7686_0784 [Paracoccus aminophilus JCM 7686]
MIAPRRNLHPVAVDALPECPIPAGIELKSHYFMQFHHQYWGNCDFRQLADRDSRCLALELIFAAQNQQPVGTLPEDPRILAGLVNTPVDEFIRICEREYGPLWEWRRCLCEDGTVRLYHLEMHKWVQDAAKATVSYNDKLESERERKRLAQLPDQIVRAGGTKAMAEDHIYVLRLDQYLLENHPKKQRRPNIVLDAMEQMELAEIRASG